MGFLEKLFGKKEEKKEEPANSYSLDEAHALLQEGFEKKFESIKKDADQIHTKMQAYAIKIQNSSNVLMNSNFSGQVDSQLLQNVLAHRKSFVEKMNVLINNINRPINLNFDEILEFCSTSSALIADIDKKTVADYQFLKELFEKEADDVIKHFKELNKLSTDFENLIDKNKGGLCNLQNLSKELKILKEDMENLEQKKSELSEAEKLILELNNQFAVAEEELKKLKASEEWIECEKMQHKRKEVEVEIAGLESEIVRTFSRIERPMKKFNKLVQSEEQSVENKGWLEKFIEAPADTFINEKNPEIINSLLKKIQTALEMDKLDIKDKEKLLLNIKSLIEENVFENFSKKHQSLTNEFNETKITSGNQKILDSTNEIENRIDGIRKEIEKSNSEINKIKEQLQKIKNSIQKRKSEIEDKMAKSIDKKVILSIGFIN